MPPPHPRPDGSALRAGLSFGPPAPCRACASTPPAATAATRPSSAASPARKGGCWASTSSPRPSLPPVPGSKRRASPAELICDSHANLLQYVRPGTADIVMFNFGWLPGADHSGLLHRRQQHPRAGSGSWTARAPGRRAQRHPLQRPGHRHRTKSRASSAGCAPSRSKNITVLVCDFANWADTAPLPCLVLKK